LFTCWPLKLNKQFRICSSTTMFKKSFAFPWICPIFSMATQVKWHMNITYSISSYPTLVSLDPCSFWVYKHKVHFGGLFVFHFWILLSEVCESNLQVWISESELTSVASWQSKSMQVNVHFHRQIIRFPIVLTVKSGSL